MKTLLKMPETDISVTDGMVEITQSDSYRSNTIKVPTYVWEELVCAVMDEMMRPHGMETEPTVELKEAA